MNLRTLARRSLRHYFRSQLGVLAGVTLAAAVLIGALAVGDSVKGSLKARALLRSELRAFHARSVLRTLPRGEFLVYLSRPKRSRFAWNSRLGERNQRALDVGRHSTTGRRQQTGRLGQG
jgi:hypothetical protein